MKFISLFLGLLMTTTVFSQKIDRWVIQDTIVRKYIPADLRFPSPLNKSDSIFIGIMADSIGPKMADVELFGYFPKNLNVKGLLIIVEYTDGSEDAFKYDFHAENNYSVFRIANDLDNISVKKAKLIKFRNITEYKIKNQDYFINFFKQL
jgi:hypothetical protein